jgi:hypothetical protein
MKGTSVTVVATDPVIRDLIHKRLVHEIHTSERRSFRGCRRRWHWVFQDFYYPQVTAKPLEFGVAFHNAMEVLYETFVDTCNAQRDQFLSLNNQAYLEDEANVDYNERIELGKGMLEYYCREVAPKYDSGFRPISVEQEFIVPIQNPDTDEYLWCQCMRCIKTQEQYWAENNMTGYELRQQVDIDGPCWEVVNKKTGDLSLWRGLPVCLAGRIDLLAQDNHGDYWIVDWKTAARLARGDVSGQDRDEFLELDDQIGSYVMALRRKLGLNVRGFIYVELKKAVPGPPQENKTVRLGKKFSVNKNQAVDVETYIATVSAEDAEAYEAGLYDEFIGFLKAEGQNFHGRYQVYKGDNELEEIERYLFMEAREMTNPDLAIYPSPGRFSCGFCAFRQPCLESFQQGDPQLLLDTLFEKRQKHYWVKQLSTDKESGE